ITQRSASTKFDLPQPFGPTMPVKPRSMTNSEGSTKDLKPSRRRREKRISSCSRHSCACHRNPGLDVRRVYFQEQLALSAVETWVPGTLALRASGARMTDIGGHSEKLPKLRNGFRLSPPFVRHRPG